MHLPAASTSHVTVHCPCRRYHWLYEILVSIIVDILLHLPELRTRRHASTHPQPRVPTLRNMAVWVATYPPYSPTPHSFEHKRPHPSFYQSYVYAAQPFLSISNRTRTLSTGIFIAALTNYMPTFPSKLTNSELPSHCEPVGAPRGLHNNLFSLHLQRGWLSLRRLHSQIVKKDINGNHC